LTENPLYVIKKWEPGTHFHEQKQVITRIFANSIEDTGNHQIVCHSLTRSKPYTGSSYSVGSATPASRKACLRSTPSRSDHSAFHSRCSNSTSRHMALILGLLKCLIHQQQQGVWRVISIPTIIAALCTQYPLSAMRWLMHYNRWKSFFM
jgi:hypothetical protein